MRAGEATEVHVGAAQLTTTAAIAGVLSVLLIAWLLMRIAHRAGYSRWWALPALIPGVNVLVLLCFAFQRWPVERELEQWRSHVQRVEQAHVAHATTSFLGY